ncbi:MAG: hypothetical protein E5X51_33550 [Mesorhizobium sp.]|uniref:hypothetical protein n=1 Tax=Mesorhizobium sp. TaxID=1871066 RepID=UPI0012223885|nr:hypothetical protein [Mesorhizobium sp.]TIQ16768.1 MAG: hypothetical protein E5X51_33550 [Mesorhizobium sp.]
MKSEEEYVLSKGFLVFMDEYLHRKDAGSGIVDVASVIKSFEEKNMAQARKSVKVGLSDILAETASFDLEKIKGIDRALSGESLPTLSQMRAKHWARYKNAIKRGEIRGEIEYYMIKAIFDDTMVGSPEEREAMSRMLSDYETPPD